MPVAPKESPAEHVDRERLWSRIEALAEVGPIPGGGSCRLALSDEDRAARDLLARWCADASLALRVDEVGNMFARRQGSDDSLPPVLLGSHLDTQPTGGRFDGVAGVVAALEVLQTLDDLGAVTERPVELVNWTNEEGARFSHGTHRLAGLGRSAASGGSLGRPRRRGQDVPRGARAHRLSRRSSSGGHADRLLLRAAHRAGATARGRRAPRRRDRSRADHEPLRPRDSRCRSARRHDADGIAPRRGTRPGRPADRALREGRRRRPRSPPDVRQAAGPRPVPSTPSPGSSESVSTSGTPTRTLTGGSRRRSPTPPKRSVTSTASPSTSIGPGERTASGSTPARWPPCAAPASAATSDTSISRAARGTTRWPSPTSRRRPWSSSAVAVASRTIPRSGASPTTSPPAPTSSSTPRWSAPGSSIGSLSRQAGTRRRAREPAPGAPSAGGSPASGRAVLSAPPS